MIDDNQAFFATLVPLFESGQATNWDITALSDWVVNLMRQQALRRSTVQPCPHRRNDADAFRDPAHDPATRTKPWQGGVTGTPTT